MSHSLRNFSNLPPEQAAIGAKCFHPSGNFIEFKKHDVEQSISSRFDKIVNNYPDRIAVKVENQVVTYFELNAMANRIARGILDLRRPQSVPIPLFLAKRVEQIASMLGVLKTGHFFVLLDSSCPTARIAETLRELGAGILLTDDQNIDLAQTIAGEAFRVIAVDSINPSSLQAPELPIDPRAVANIRYTSGSTGRPKGVIQSHRNLLHQIMLYTNAYQICAQDRISVLTVNTGNTITSTFLALLNGAALLPFEVQNAGTNRLASWLLNERITFAIIGSPLFRSLCESLTGNERFSDLRLIRLASEAAYRSDFELYKKHFPSTCFLANALSSSETNLLTTFYIDHKTEIAGDELPLGYGFDDKQILLLNDAGQRLGSNETGEIVVRSKFLSPGYWNRSDLTNAKFKPDPEDPEKQLYFTGDLGLMLPNGCLIHKGRKDFRVKVRGYGVDLVEVENTLRSHPSVKEAVVVARANESGEARLLGYFSVRGETRLTVTELRQFLLEHLSDYMVPAAFVRLDVMPMTPNGKVDRRSLPVPDDSRPELETPFMAPETPLEEQLTKIWAQVLGLSRIGIHDNFFDLGGHSLAATRVVSQVIKEVQLELTPQAVFQAPTVAEMATLITERQIKQQGEKDRARMIDELESLSDDQAQKLLDNQPVVERR
jgi:amino acid adenylation domain-containing protein